MIVSRTDGMYRIYPEDGYKVLSTDCIGVGDIIILEDGGLARVADVDYISRNVSVEPIGSTETIVLRKLAYRVSESKIVGS